MRPLPAQLLLSPPPSLAALPQPCSLPPSCQAAIFAIMKAVILAAALVVALVVPSAAQPTRQRTRARTLYTAELNATNQAQMLWWR